MYARKPVIASDCLPIKRIIEETGSGILYAHDNTDQLAQIFDALPQYDVVQMGINGEKAVANKYNWNVDGKILTGIYQG
jgi:glycosyltransferase involved in cell wall biosynthesis